MLKEILFQDVIFGEKFKDKKSDDHFYIKTGRHIGVRVDDKEWEDQFVAREPVWINSD